MTFEEVQTVLNSISDKGIEVNSPQLPLYIRTAHDFFAIMCEWVLYQSEDDDSGLDYRDCTVNDMYNHVLNMLENHANKLLQVVTLCRKQS